MEKTEKINFNLDPWEQRFTWYWLKGKEIFDYDQNDFDNVAKDLYEKGINIIITFSNTHFRIGFYPYWKDYNDSLRMLVTACHKYGIRVVEHHSAHLTHNLRSHRGWWIVRRNLGGSGRSMEGWADFLEFLSAGLVIDGKDITTFSQIDGKTGQIAENAYGAYSMCFNNPDYREVYFNYLRDVVDTGIDGIMNDDVQYFGGERNGNQGRSCTCKYCRDLFFKETGYTLPEPEGWDEFFDNFEDPVYIAWKKFKLRSTERMYRDLTKFYEEELGVKLLRPQYCSSFLNHNTTCYGADYMLDAWDFIFQENCIECHLKQSYMDYMTESVHRFAVGKRYNIPSMSMFYPHRPDMVYFSWALAHSWGQLYMGSDSNDAARIYGGLNALEVPYRDFENKYLHYYKNPNKISDISIYFSRKTRDLVTEARKNHTFKLMATIQAAYVSNLTVDMVFEEDSVEEMLRHRIIVLSHISMTDNSEMDKFSEFVRRGGTLVIIGEFANKNSDGSNRSKEDVAKYFGRALVPGETFELGQGKVIYSSYKDEEDLYQPSIWDSAAFNTDPVLYAIPSKWEAQKKLLSPILLDVIGEQNVKITCENDRIATTYYSVDDALLLHLVNLADTIPSERILISKKDPIPNFCPDAKKLPVIKVTAKIPDDKKITKVRLVTPEIEKSIDVSFEIKDNVVEAIIPDGMFSGYAMLIMD